MQRLIVGLILGVVITWALLSGLWVQLLLGALLWFALYCFYAMIRGTK